MRGKNDLDPSLFGLAHIILIVALAHGGGQHARLNWLFFVPIAYICIHMVFLAASESATSDYALSLSIATFFFTTLDFILLRTHQKELRMIGQEKDASEMSFMERLVWGTKLVASSRGIGWTHEPPHLAPRPTSIPRRFILSQLIWIAFYIIQFDVTLILIRENPCFAKGGPSLAAYGWLWRATSWLYVLSAYSSLSMLYATCSIVAVALGVTEPCDWPHLFGSPGDAYTLRKCWGRVWHQMLRKPLTSHANFVAKILHLPKSTFTTYFKLFIVFFISGIIHYAGDYMLHQNWSGTSMQFFLLQAAAITFEDAVIALAAQAGYTKPSTLLKSIGFLWIFTWFTFCLPLWLDEPLHAGTFDDGVNVSLILGLWRGEWLPKRVPLI